MSASFLGTTIFLLMPYLDVFRRTFISSSNGGFVGLDNIKQVIQNDAFALAVKNTCMFTAICIPLLLLFSLLLSLLLLENKKTNKLLRSFFLLPLAIPVTSLVILWHIMYDNSGFINSFLYNHGFKNVNWLESDCAFIILVVSYLWKNLGYNVILWTAALSTIPDYLYESARVDGANKWQSFYRITLPNLLPAISIITTLSIINSFKVFREAFLVAGSYPSKSIYMVQHVFNNWFRDLSLDKISAGSFLNSFILILLIIVLQRLWNKED